MFPKLLRKYILLFTFVLLTFYALISPYKVYADKLDTATQQSLEQNMQKEAPIEYIKARILDIKNNVPCLYTEESVCTKYIVQNVKTEKTFDIVMDLRSALYVKNLKLHKNDTVIVQHQGDSDFIIGIDRTLTIIFLTIFFIILVILVSGKQGLSTLIGLATTLAVMLYIFIPAILHGYNPILIGFILSFILLVISVYFSHGFNKKSHAVLIATSLGLFLAWIFAILTIHITRLTGLTSEEYITLNSTLPISLDISKILVTVIILGVLGSIDDVAINQASVIMSLLRQKPNITNKELYKEAHTIGKDHVASMINTLVIVYISSALPIVLLLAANGTNLIEILNRELFVQEIVKSIVVSSILVVTVPITNVIAIVIGRARNKSS